jgi:sulfur carrier protein
MGLFQQPMRLIVNGYEELFPENVSLAEVIRGHDEYDVHMIVELNHCFVHRKDYETTILHEGDVLELIHPAFGG